MNWVYVGSEKISSTATSSAVYTLTPPSSLGFIQRAKIEVIQGTVNDAVYYTFDGTAPTSANGKRLFHGESAQSDHRAQMLVGADQIARLKLSCSTAAVGIQVNYYG